MKTQKSEEFPLKPDYRNQMDVNQFLLRLVTRGFVFLFSDSLDLLFISTGNQYSFVFF